MGIKLKPSISQIQARCVLCTTAVIGEAAYINYFSLKRNGFYDLVYLKFS
jgi:hypothetical protein